MQLWIVDTNIVVSGLLSKDQKSPTAQVLNDMLSAQMIFVLSPALLAEYRAVLLRPALTERHGLSEPEIDQILIELTANAKWSEPDSDAIHTPPDGGDAHLWALLACHPEAVLLTGDRLLVENPRPGSRITMPSDYKKLGSIPNLLNQDTQVYRPAE